MLSQEQNELLTRVGPGTPMGDVLRRYWIPALLDWELPAPDCTPVRMRLMGEDLVAFRDTSGRIGVLDENCPHRLTSLWLARNEENGLRCVYHGWKFDVTGQCVDQMNEPEQFASKIKTRSYPAVEKGGVVWVYMGPEDKQPPLPNFAWTQVGEDHRVVTKVVEECNWLQALEGGHRHLARADHASDAAEGVVAAGDSGDGRVRAGLGAGAGGGRDGLRLPVLRHTAVGGG